MSARRVRWVVGAAVAAMTLAVVTPMADALEITQPANVPQTAKATQRAERVTTPTPPPPTTQPPAETGNPLLDRVLELTNAERSRYGLPPLRLEPRLMQAAQSHSAYQATHHTMTHWGRNGESAGDRITATGYIWRAWGENVAMGYRTAEAVVAAWMASPGHRANILNAGVTEIGLGLVDSVHDVPFWTQVFAAPYPT